MLEKIYPNFTYRELEEAKPRFVALPIGSFEQHGRHLPMTTDSVIAGILAQRLAGQYGGFALPPLPVSCSHEHGGFWGSMWFSATTLIAIIRDLVGSAAFHGIDAAVIVNAHGGNYVLNNVAQELNCGSPRVIILPAASHWEYAARDAGIESSRHDDMHAGEVETSILLHEFPALVRTGPFTDQTSGDRRLLHVYGMKEFSGSGVVGFPSLATAEKGARVLDAVTNGVGDDLERFLRDAVRDG